MAVLGSRHIALVMLQLQIRRQAAHRTRTYTAPAGQALRRVYCVAAVRRRPDLPAVTVLVEDNRVKVDLPAVARRKDQSSRSVVNLDSKADRRERSDN